MWVPLHVHSYYSFLRGSAAPAAYVRLAVERGFPALALTDTGGLYGAVAFYQEAREQGVKPIIGVELEYHQGQRSRKCPIEAPWVGPCTPSAVILLARDFEGYSNLCRLVTRRQLDDRPLEAEDLAQHREGLFCLAHELDPLPELKQIFGADLYLEARHYGDVASRKRLRLARQVARELGIEATATAPAHFAHPEDHHTHRVMNAVRVGEILSRLPEQEAAPATGYLRPAAEVERLFDEWPEAVHAAGWIAEMCNLELPTGELVFPDFELPTGETAFSYLWKLCFQGAVERYRPLTHEAIRRLERELAVIEKQSLAPYFLIVWDIVREARARGIPTVGRGSAASSIVSYCLGITRLCPIKNNLYFERFMNEHRRDCPDIDLDICGRRRDELLDYVYRKYGAEHTAMISSFVTFQARLAVREVAKVMGLSPLEIDAFCRRLPHRPVAEILDAVATLPECRALPAAQEPYKSILETAQRLDGMPRHLSIHPCGTVITPSSLTRLVPLEVATKGIVVTQYDMHSIEALGLLKMDLLGQRALTTISDTLAAVRARGVELDFDAIPEGDPETLERLRHGRTLGVFQIESPGMRNVLKALDCTTIEQTCLALAVIRPGAAEYGSKELFLKRLRGQAPVTYPHPALEPILAESMGVCIYQEQVLLIAQAMAGLSLADADLLRRLMTHQRSAREMEKFRQEFITSSSARGVPQAVATQVWQSLSKFAGYGFCKAHAMTYAEIAYRILYLKAHYPAEFMAAVCSSMAGFYHVSAYVEEARRMGLEVLPPCVNRSVVAYSVEEGRRAIRIGLMQVKDLRATTMDSILEARRTGGAFTSLSDFLRRVDAERSEVETLIKCGAMDCFENTRPEMLWRLELVWERIEQQKKARGEAWLFSPATASPAEPVGPRGVPLPRLPDYTPLERMEIERETLDVFSTAHPLDFVAANGATPAAELERRRHQTVTVVGWMITHRRVGTKNMKNMLFVTLEDRTGVVEVVLFPEVYEKYGPVIYESGLLKATGRVEADGQLNCQRLEALKPQTEL
ncbi:MAG: DNA polymerase III subunit alpha [Acidobacteria bacterium]|nr:DNA polymerase III subunit alpha [Acidobacteriota bacterium]